MATKDEQPKDVEVVKTKSVTTKDVKSLYNQGKNVNQIAKEVFGFESEEGAEQVRKVLGVE